MEVKICGLTRAEHALYLNESGADYAGFVFFQKSKRNVSLEQAGEIMHALDERIKKVAVTVSPDIRLVDEIENAGFDILQVHDNLSGEVLEKVQIPVWYAVNIADEESLREKTEMIYSFPKLLSDKIKAILVDGAEYGGGKTFDWQKPQAFSRDMSLFSGRKFILAGGLNASNVQEGIARFSPDVVDVSSGVETAAGKDQKLINEFIRKVKGYE